MNSTNNILGDTIRQKRERHSDYKSLRAFASALGRSPSWVSKMERGIEKPSPDTLAQIAELLDLSPPMLFWAAGMIEPDVEAYIHAHYVTLAPMIRDMMQRRQVQNAHKQQSQETEETR